MEIINVSIDKLKPFEDNPKIHPPEQIKKIERSIREFGWTNPVLVTKDNMIIAGHGRIEAAKKLNISEIPVIYIDLPYEKAVAYVLADNKLAELADWDKNKLSELFDDMSLPYIQLGGFDLNEIDKILDTNNESDEFTIEDFEFDDLYEPCWFVIRAPIDEYEKIKTTILELNATIEGSLDGQLKP